MERDSNPPKDVGESQTRSGEEISDDEGKEPGRKDAGSKGAAERPVGTSTARDFTGVDPQEPIGEDGPDASKGGGSQDR